MEKCNSCEQMKKEGKAIRKALTDTNSNFVAVVNENLILRRKLEDNGIYYHDALKGPSDTIRVK